MWNRIAIEEVDKSLSWWEKQSKLFWRPEKHQTKQKWKILVLSKKQVEKYHQVMMSRQLKSTWKRCWEIRGGVADFQWKDKIFTLSWTCQRTPQRTRSKANTGILLGWSTLTITPTTKKRPRYSFKGWRWPMTSWVIRTREKFMTSTDQQESGCARNMVTKWPEAGTRDSCGPQLCAWHGTSPRQLVGSVASAVFAAANLARHMMTSSLLRRDSSVRGRGWEPS